MSCVYTQSVSRIATIIPSAVIHAKSHMIDLWSDADCSSENVSRQKLPYDTTAKPERDISSEWKHVIVACDPGVTINLTSKCEVPICYVHNAKYKNRIAGAILSLERRDGELSSNQIVLSPVACVCAERYFSLQ